jgi:TorA maturation chaperone TorD
MAHGTPSEGEAWARLFRLFARVVADGLDPALKREIAALPELAGTMDAGRAPDEEAADHQDLFGFRVAPYAGVFLDADGRVGGPAADAALQACAAAGFQRIRDDLGPDHLASELSFLAHCAEHGRVDAAGQFLDTHVLAWLPSLTAAVAREPYPAYSELLTVLEEAVLDYRAAIGGPAAPLPDLPEPDALLDDPRAGVREIAGFLACPARSGVHLGRGDVTRLGRSASAPTGFGGRTLMLANLLRSAAEYDRLGSVISALDDIARATLVHWKRVGSTGAGAAEAWAGRWTGRIGITRRMLSEIEARIRKAQADGSGS